MRPCEYPNCRNMGQQHHIVFRSQGGMNIDVNYAYLCADHHTGLKCAVHNCREFDLQLKKDMQEKLFRMFPHDIYTIEQIAQIIDYDRNRLQKKFKTVPSRAGHYKSEDIVRKLMGDRLY